MQECDNTPVERTSASPNGLAPRKWLSWFGKAALSFLLVTYCVGKVEWGLVSQQFAGASYPWLVAGFLVLLGIVPLGAARWRIIIHTLNARTRFTSVLRLTMVSNFFNAMAPGGVAGELVRGYQSKSLGLTLENGLGSVMTDRIMGLLGMVVMASVGALTSWRQLVTAGLMTYLAVTAVLVVLTAILMYSDMASRLIGKLPVFRGKVRESMARLSRGLRQFKGHKGAMTRGLAITMLAHTMMVAGVYFYAVSLGSHAHFAYFIVFVPIIGVISSMPVTFSGIGLREAGYLYLFPMVGMTQTQALGVSLLLSFTVVATALLCATAVIWPERPPDG